MFASILKNWKTSLLGILAGSLGALYTTAGLDSMTPKQVALAYLTCLAVAVKGLISADAPKAE